MNVLCCYSNFDSEIQMLRYSKITKHNVKFASTYNSIYISPDINLNYFFDVTNLSNKKVDIFVDYLKQNSIDLILTDNILFILKIAKKFNIEYFMYSFDTSPNEMKSKSNTVFLLQEKHFGSVPYIIPYYEKSLPTDNQISFSCLNNDKKFINRIKNIDCKIFSDREEDFGIKIGKLFSKEYKEALSSNFLIIEDNVTLAIDCIFNKKYFYILNNKNNDFGFLLQRKICEYINNNTKFERSMNNFVDFSGYRYLHNILGE